MAESFVGDRSGCGRARGVKNRQVAVEFAGLGTAVMPAGAASGDAVQNRVPAEKPGPPALAWVLGGVGVAGLGAFTFFGLKFNGQLNDRDACMPNCSTQDADRASTTRKLAFVSLGIGVVSIGAATWLFLSPRSAPEQHATSISWMGRFNVLGMPGGALGQVVGRF